MTRDISIIGLGWLGGATGKAISCQWLSRAWFGYQHGEKTAVNHRDA